MRHEREAKGLTRRDFLRQTGFSALAGLAGWRLLSETESAFAAAEPEATVVLVRDLGALKSDGTISARAVARMVAQGVQALTGKAGGSGWRQLFRPSDVAGVKFSRCGWMRVPTSQEVVDGVVAGLRSVPIAVSNIHSGDYGLPVTECTALVNVASVKAHPLCGMAAAIKNYINFHPKPEIYHEQSNAKLPEVWLRPEVKGKTRLVVLDLLTPYFGTGPQVDPRYQATYGGILVAKDPVAADAIALALCLRLREQHRREPWPINPPPLFLAAAERKYHLGVSDPARIRLVRLGDTKGMLV